MTKLEEILLKRELSQGDLIKIIKKNTGQKLGRDRVSKICTGRLKNYTIRTAVMIKEALDLKFEDFIEYEFPKKIEVTPEEEQDGYIEYDFIKK